jgi:hypothetical protein
MNCLFSYGSNSIYQLRARVENYSLQSYPAYVEGYKRIFCENSQQWKGAIATLYPKKYAITYGIIVYLTDEELNKLDEYEKHYTKQELCATFFLTNETIQCITYISNNNIWLCHPSNQYLTAIQVMLNEHYINKYIIISSLIDNKIVNHEKWYFHKNLLTIESLCILVNTKKKIPWKIPMEMNSIVHKLGIIHINNINDFKLYLQNYNTFNELNLKLKRKDLPVFQNKTLLLFRTFLFEHINEH